MAIVVVGASVAGIRAVQALRMHGYEGDVVVIGEEVHLPYDKPPLTKEVLTTGEPVALVTSDELAALKVDLRLGIRATALDPAAHIVSTSDGQSVSYSQLVIATGVRPRTLPGASSTQGVHTIRTADDAVTLYAALQARPRVVVVGAGFIGSEFAYAARRFDCDVSIVEAQAVPMAQLLGVEVGAALARLHELNDVHLHTGVPFDHFETTTDGRVAGVALRDGRTLPADLVVVGIGAEPAIDWLRSSGLPISNGIECDERLRVVGFDDIHAAGDIASWPHPLYAQPLRIEHWTNANEHASIVAASILGEPAPAAHAPYVWSDQYGHRIQIVGQPRAGTLVSLTGTVDDHLTAVYADSDGAVVGGVAVDNVRTLMTLRKAVVKRAQADEVTAALAVPARR